MKQLSTSNKNTDGNDFKYALGERPIFNGRDNFFKIGVDTS